MVFKVKTNAKIEILFVMAKEFYVFLLIFVCFFIPLW